MFQYLSEWECNGKLPTLIYSTQPEHLREPVGDKSDLAKIIYTFENISPLDLLKSAYNGAEPTDRDKKLVENLMLNQQLPPGVINVLMSTLNISCKANFFLYNIYNV